MGVLSGGECWDEQIVYSSVELNYPWIVGQLGGDLDHDGVLDGLDNCPPTRCKKLGLAPEACANPDQADDDDDGIGEVCDNCPASKCATTVPGFDCVNPDQADGDQDGEGDQCDLCPDKATLTYDEDGDGVGEACDNCPGLYQEFPHCGTNAVCTGRCITTGSSPHCSQLPDRDGDGTGDSCDTCPDIASYDTKNSNSWSEQRELAAPIVDVCDQVPQVRVTQTHRDNFGAPTVILGAEPILGGGVPAVSGRAQMGFCSCHDPVDGRDLNEEECLDNQQQCSAWKYPQNSIWHPVTLGAGGDITQVTSFPPSPLSFTSSFSFEPVGALRSKEMYWNWRADVDAGRIDGIDCPGGTCRAYGAFMMSSIVSTSTSNRDGFYAIRDTHKVVRAPFLRESPAHDVPEWLDPCAPSGCTWYRPDLELIRPPEWLAQPGVLVVEQDGAPSILTEEGPYLATLEANPAVVQALSTPGQRWISAAETPRQTAVLKAALPGLEAVRVPRDLGDNIQGLTLQRGGGEVGLGSFGSLGGDGPGLGFAALASQQASPGRRIGPEYVLSATLGQLFVVGGEVGVDPIAAGDIWRYDLARGSWLKLDTTFFAPSRILSSTFDASSQRLVVLSLDDDDRLLGHARAQVHTIDVRTGASKLVLFWPYLGIFNDHAVAVLEDGSLVLAASKGHKTTLWQFRSQMGQYWPAGRVNLKGSMLDRPVAVDNGLLFALANRKGNVQVKSVIDTDFKPGLPCGGL
ncbi:MAG: thrombospondin type 3 repeat-containing protein [Polyangiaceae bacterium]